MQSSALPYWRALLWHCSVCNCSVAVTVGYAILVVCRCVIW
jgi:hypothetical protein